MTIDSIVERILSLRKRREAVILAHNYQPPEIQDIADMRGDSLALSREAAEAQAKVIVFCGVRFMAETAAILCPGSTVLLPDPEAGCPMADMMAPGDVERMRGEHPGAAVVTYVNSTVEVKAVSDACCTSGNGLKVVESFPPGQEIIFGPDQYLGHFLSTQTSRTFHLWRGYCPSHMKILVEDIERAREEHPDAKIMVHPECTPDVIRLADVALGTGGMIRYAAESGAKEFVVGTEVGMVYRLEKDIPGKKFYPATSRALCPNMKKITLEKVLWSLEEMEPRVTVPPDVAARAKQAVDRMLASV
ncbi:MAG: quinolinate synthase NadA [Candidatus Eisenbacteria sp.]|nr:quinolinate synthase NadA [Candidatus Eisenbacteria bacterium]